MDIGNFISRRYLECVDVTTQPMAEWFNHTIESTIQLTWSEYLRYHPDATTTSHNWKTDQSEHTLRRT